MNASTAVERQRRGSERCSVDVNLFTCIPSGTHGHPMPVVNLTSDVWGPWRVEMYLSSLSPVLFHPHYPLHFVSAQLFNDIPGDFQTLKCGLGLCRDILLESLFGPLTLGHIPVLSSFVLDRTISSSLHS